MDADKHLIARKKSKKNQQRQERLVVWRWGWAGVRGCEVWSVWVCACGWMKCVIGEEAMEVTVRCVCVRVGG